MTMTRFAPAPSGHLHLGNVRTALLNFLFAKHYGGKFFIRIDDTDAHRQKDAYITAIQENLSWLHVSWDGWIQQSQMSYLDIVDFLKKTGRLYPCYETTEELQDYRAQRLAAGLPPVYKPKKSIVSSQRKPHFRFALLEEEVMWNDLIRGRCSYHTKHLSDPIVIREDGSISYMLASVADDIRLHITHILRGEDHVTNTAVQIQLFQALNAPVPIFAHFPLLSDAMGQKLSKRLQAVSMQDLRQRGALPMAIINVLVCIGSGIPVSPNKSLEEIIRDFSLSVYGRSAPCLDIENIFQVTKILLQNMSYTKVCEEMGTLYPSTHLWDVIRHNISTLEEIPFWIKVCEDTMSVSCIVKDIDKDVVQAAYMHLPSPPWNIETWALWMKKVQEVTGRAGRSLYLPVRLALTGREDGPKMQELLPLIHPDIVKKRLLEIC